MSVQRLRFAPAGEFDSSVRARNISVWVLTSRVWGCERETMNPARCERET